MRKLTRSDFAPAQMHTTLSTGEVVKMVRDLKGWTQEELAKRCQISATNISLLEHNRVDIGEKELNCWHMHSMFIPRLLCFRSMRLKRLKRQLNNS